MEEHHAMTTTLLSPEALPNPTGVLVPAAIEAAPAAAPYQDGNSIPGIITAAGEKALFSFVNFFSAGIENENTRRAYLQAWREFGKWAEGRGVRLD